METNEYDELTREIEYDEAHIENSIEPSAIEKSLLEIIRKLSVELDEKRKRIIELKSDEKESVTSDNEDEDDDDENDNKCNCRCHNCSNYHSFS